MLKVFDDGDGAFSASDGVKLFYRRVGQGSKALVFLHGWGGSSSYWNHMLPHIDSSFVVDRDGDGVFLYGLCAPGACLINDVCEKALEATGAPQRGAVTDFSDYSFKISVHSSTPWPASVHR
jgi:hypothetical protein